MLKQGTSEDFINATKLNYEEWGSGLTMDQYLERETVSKKYVSGHRPWILVDKENENQVLASCETFSNESLYAFKGDTKIYRGISESVASVFIEQKYRGKGLSSQLMKQLYSRFESEGRIFCDLYSDVDPKVYSKCGWNSYPATSLKVDLSNTEKNSKFIKQDYTLQEANSRKITEENIGMVLEKDIETTQKELIEFVNSDRNTNSFAFTKLFTTTEFYWEISQSKVYATSLNINTPTTYGHVIFNTKDGSVQSYIVWSLDFRASELKVLKLVAQSEIEFKFLIKKAYEQALEYNFKYIYSWWCESTSKFNKAFVESIGYEIIIRDGSIPMVCSWIKDNNTNQLLDQSKGIWINVEKFGWV
ncbi:hypothetical protein DICPUDRAFT_29694 [Dictyostelium purpureum]|uniref:LYC1 C-terminal domain-containing protein n=1 Tax=Dictyostelium purpureum TaxID=5786 RepID=F0ZDZ7_DICPU|nr:uncharacterized protein DICPUDRAFT_29694 [Dictyostelium purpureum]EGC37793.1 hypothetical protein DICPUDRAFT_29694 [Dictyostelium purpureum]|eukprot:XP_003285638.1 hypothetical protein DICPUDRAFT_29694 [Dictyostelium purpureum]